MYIGIDVGGTYTDGVLLEDKRIVKKVKEITMKDDLVSSILNVLDYLIDGIDIKRVIKIVFSTTLITNLVVENKLDPVALITLSGNGIAINNDFYKSSYSQEIPGAIDYRGREVIPLDMTAVKQILENLSKSGYQKVAVAGKFAQRNNSHEIRIGELLKTYYPQIQYELSHKVSGELNFPRRVASTLLTLATKDNYLQFVEQVRLALTKRSISCPAYVLKADGGTLPLDKSVESPIETVLSGPAASLLGVMALTPDTEGSIVLDIGGTTTDIGFIVDKKHPLMASKGANLGGYLTQVRAFNVKAIPVGGDSQIEIINGVLKISPYRVGQAYCMGGPKITPSDALRFLDLLDIGCKKAAEEGLTAFGLELALSPIELANLIINKFLEILEYEILSMLESWRLEPAYRIWELKNQKPNIYNIVGVGGGSKGILALLGKRMGRTVISPPQAEVTNAIGAALAVPTPTVTLRIDTEQGFYCYYEEGVQDLLPRGFKDDDVLELAKYLHFRNKTKEDPKATKFEIVRQEFFNIIRGTHRVGKIIIVKLQVPWEIEYKLYEEDA